LLHNSSVGNPIAALESGRGKRPIPDGMYVFAFKINTYLSEYEFCSCKGGVQMGIPSISSRLLGLCVLGMAVLTSPGGVPGSTIDNNTASAVKVFLNEDPHTGSKSIEVHSINGIVTLKGSVDNLLSRERAAEIAKTVKGVRSVVNLIAINPEARSDEQIRQDLRRVFDKNDSADRLNIHAEVNNGIVTLSGSVESWQEKSICIRLAQSVPGVKQVDSNIVVRPVIDRPDEAIEAEIRRLLVWDVWVKENRIQVNVAGGRVYLSGQVGSIGEKTRVFRNAWVSGVIAVNGENLRVRPDQCSASRKNMDYDLKSVKEVRNNIKDALANDPRIKNDDVQIEVDPIRTAILNGVVNSEAERKAIEEDIKNTVGVFLIDSKLKTRSSMAAKAVKPQSAARNGQAHAGQGS
jgi:osmotically-inducible protein OsmY